jgi:hypothetical protein
MLRRPWSLQVSYIDTGSSPVSCILSHIAQAVPVKLDQFSTAFASSIALLISARWSPQSQLLWMLYARACEAAPKRRAAVEAFIAPKGIG